MHILEMNFTILILINYEHDTFVYYIDTIKICLFDISLYCVGTPDMFDISLYCVGTPGLLLLIVDIMIIYFVLTFFF